MTPRFRRDQRRLICTRSQALHVRLRFESDGREFEVTRALSRKNPGECVLIDHSSGDRTMGAEQVTRKVIDLVGLDFEAFCSSVLLAQNRFSALLDATPKERVNILKGVFRLERIDELRSAARRRITRLDVDLAGIEGERRTIPDDAAELHDAAVALATSARSRAAMLEDAQPDERRLQETAREATSELAAAQTRLETLSEVVDLIPSRLDLEALAEEEAEVDRRVARADQDLRVRSEIAEEAAAALLRLEAELGGERALIEARSLATRASEARDDVARLHRAMGDADDRLRDASERSELARRREGEARRSWEEARSRRRAVERDHAAHSLRSELHSGEPCPVCLRKLTKVPRAEMPQGLQTVIEEEEAAERTANEARRVCDEASQELAEAKSALEHCSEQSDRARAKLAELDEQVRTVIAPTDDPLAEIDRRLDRLSEARVKTESAASERELARSERDACVAAQGEFSLRRHAVAGALIEVAGRLNLEPVGVAASVERLISHAGAASEVLAARMEEARSSIAECESARAAAERDLVALHARLGLEAGTIEEALADARAQSKIAEQQAASLEKQMARAAELEAEANKLTGRRAVFERLADDFRDNNFVHFLLEDRRRLLSELGSERLRELSLRYRFDDGAEFDVVDEFDGDKIRKTDTLSGGETFLASLALALALAEAVARSGGRLQCFFLDEGFGSLDAESLDLALDGIERIVGPQRLIGLVSHVAALAARVDDRIELSKDEDGMTEVVRGAEAV